jgi:hypothetical protein
MTAQLAPPIVFKDWDANGAPLAFGTVATYLAGSTTPQATYVDSTLTTQNTNPVQLNNRGEANIWLDPTKGYKFVVFDSAGNQIHVVDNIIGPINIGTSLIPSANNTFDIGSASFQWRTGYFGTSVLINGVPAVTYPQTAAEIAAGVTPTNYGIPNHLATGEVYPQRYGAKFDNATDDTVAMNNAFLVGSAAGCQVVMPAGGTVVTNLLFGTNSVIGQSSSYPPGLRGQGIQTVIRAKAGSSGTVLAAKGLVGAFFRDFVVDATFNQNVCIDTSWPGTSGPSAQNTYENVITQNFNQNGWLAINDNQSTWKDVSARQAASIGLSGFRCEGAGGSIFLDNVSVGNSWLSITAQSALIRGGFSYGVRFNESQNSSNFISFSGGTQIYINSSTNTHFQDVSGHYIGGISANGLYLIGNTGANPTNTINCAISGKCSLRNSVFIKAGGYTGTWNLYGAGAVNPFPPYNTIVELDGSSYSGVNMNTPATGFLTIQRDTDGTSGVVSDVPTRVVYRNTYTFGGGLGSGVWTNVIPASAMTETASTYLLCIYVNNPGNDVLAVAVNVSAVTKTGALAASGAISIPTSANISNNLTAQISARYSATVQISGPWYAGIDVSLNEVLANNSTISVILLRLANPSLTY